MEVFRLEDVIAIVKLYEDGKPESERLLFRGLQSELVTLIGNENVLKEAHGIFNLDIDGVYTEVRIEIATADFQHSGKLKFMIYQVVPNKLNFDEVRL